MAATAKLAQMSKSFFAAPFYVKHLKSLLNGSCKCLAVQNARFIATDPQRKPRNTFFVGLGPSSIQNFEAFCSGRRRTRRLPAVKTEICRFLSQGGDKHIDFDDIKLMLKRKLETDKVGENSINERLELLNVLFQHRQQQVDATVFQEKADAMKPSDLYALASDVFSLQDKVGQEAALLSGPLFKSAADAGDSNAKYSYAQLLRTGQAGMEADPKQAGKILSELAKQGHPFSQFTLAGMYYAGVGVSQNFETAYTLYQIAAENGIFQGFNMIGKMYLEGHSVSADFKKAFEYFQKGADKGDVHAFMSLAHCYTHEKGVEKDDNEAFRYHKLAADKDYPPAIFNLGAHYFSGRGVDLDMCKAAEYFRVSADKGFDYAQINLGNMYYHGLGVQKDWEKARDLYKKAAATNHNARLLLEELETEMKKKGITTEK